jgi:hypothetical protein
MESIAFPAGLGVLQLAAGRARGVVQVEHLLFGHLAALREDVAAALGAATAAVVPAQHEHDQDHRGHDREHAADAVADHALAPLLRLSLPLPLLALLAEGLLAFTSVRHGGEP